MQLCDRIENLVAVGNIIVLLLHIPITYCQNLPSEDDDKFKFAINPVDSFHLNRIIPDGNSVPTYLQKGEPENYFFRVEKNNLPLKITLTPCSALINWTIKRRELQPDFENIDEDDDELSDPDPHPFHAQRSANPNKYSVIGNFSGSEALTYCRPRVRSGLYMIKIVAVNNATSVNIYGSTAPSSCDNVKTVLRILPDDKSVSVISNSPRMIIIKWKKSDLNIGLHTSLEYCVVVNRVRNFKNHCSAVTRHLRDHPPKKSDSWGFSWERKPQTARQLDKPTKGGGKIFYKCVGSNTKYIFNNAKPGKTYFVDVFVLNRKFNIDAAYSGTNVKTDKRKKKRRKVILQDGKRKTIKLQKGDSEQLVVFKAKRRIDAAVLELKSCRGRIPITIYHENSDIHRTVVRSVKVLRMKNLPEGQYTVKLTGNPNRKRVLSILLTSETYTKPRLPLDTRIIVYKNASTCSSVTLEWLATSMKQRYCLYMRESSRIPSKRSHHCLEMSGRRKKDKVMCTRRKHRYGYNIKKVVENLKANTNYVFDVYVNRGNSASLAYQSVIARTKSSCKK